MPKPQGAISVSRLMSYSLKPWSPSLRDVVPACMPLMDMDWASVEPWTMEADEPPPGGSRSTL